MDWNDRLDRMRRLAAGVFWAMGGMFSFTPRAGLGREVYVPPEDEAAGGIARHFEAVWDLLGRAVGADCRKDRGRTEESRADRRA